MKRFTYTQSEAICQFDHLDLKQHIKSNTFASMCAGALYAMDIDSPSATPIRWFSFIRRQYEDKSETS